MSAESRFLFLRSTLLSWAGPLWLWCERQLRYWRLKRRAGAPPRLWGAPNGRLQRRFPFWRPHARELGRPILPRVPLLLVRSPRSLVHSPSIAYFAPWIGQVLTFDKKNENFREFKNFHKIWKKVQELIKKFTNLKKSSSIKKNRFWKMKILNMRTNVSKIVRKFQIFLLF